LKIRADLQKTGQRIGAAEMKTNGGEPLVEAADDVEDEGAVGDGFAKIPEVLCLTLVLPTVVDDREVTLTKGAKIGVGVQGTRGLIPEKWGLDCKPDVAGGGTVLGDGVSEVVSDGVEEPGPHDTIHVSPIGGGGNSGVREDMALQRIRPKGKE
jgi:hypothetical protein